MLTGIEQAFAGWSNQAALDAGDTIVRILRLIGGYERSWVGVPQDGFPGCGQVIGPPFTLEDAVTWHNKQTE